MPEDKCHLKPNIGLMRGRADNYWFHFAVAILCCHILVFAVPLQSLHLPSNSSCPARTLAYTSNGNHAKMESNKHCQCSGKISESSCTRRSLSLLDANFFNDTQIVEIDNGAKEFNIPIIRANRELVAFENGGLHDPSPLVFNADWGYQSFHSENKRFKYPTISGIQRPKSEEDIAFTSILELAELIKTRQITSQELTQIFLRRLKRYNPVLEAVVTYTEELAHRQAKEADELLSRGVYLGSDLFPCM